MSSRVPILPGADFTYLLYPINRVPLIRSLADVQHYLLSYKNICLVVQLEAIQNENVQIEQKIAP